MEYVQATVLFLIIRIIKLIKKLCVMFNSDVSTRYWLNNAKLWSKWWWRKPKLIKPPNVINRGKRMKKKEHFLLSILRNSHGFSYSYCPLSKSCSELSFTFDSCGFIKPTYSFTKFKMFFFFTSKDW